MKKNKHIGPSFDELLKEEGTLEAAELAAIKKEKNNTNRNGQNNRLRGTIILFRLMLINSCLYLLQSFQCIYPFFIKKPFCFPFLIQANNCITHKLSHSWVTFKHSYPVINRNLLFD